jgi:hypothetical protein
MQDIIEAIMSKEKVEMIAMVTDDDQDELANFMFPLKRMRPSLGVYIHTTVEDNLNKVHITIILIQTLPGMRDALDRAFKETTLKFTRQPSQTA